MTFTLLINTGNDAFHPDPRIELSRILQGIVDKMRDGDNLRDYQTIMDINGNSVGRYTMKGGKP